MKHCPHCDGLVQDGAIKCKHCKRFIERKNEEKVRENENIFKNPVKENIVTETEKIKIQENPVSVPQNTVITKQKSKEKDIGKKVSISIISISIFILFIYMLVNFVKSQNIEHKENINSINPITTEKPREIKTEEKPQIINNPSKTEEKPIEKPKEEKRWEMKKILQDVNLRSESTSSSEKIHTIYEWDEVEVLGKTTNSQGYLWYKVKHEWVEWWISYVGFEKKEEEISAKQRGEYIDILDLLEDIPINKYVNWYQKWDYYYVVLSQSDKDEPWQCDYQIVSKYQSKNNSLVFIESRITKQKYALAQDAPEYPQKDCRYLWTGPTQAQIVWESVWF